MTFIPATCPRCGHDAAGELPKPSKWRALLGLGPQPPYCPEMSDGYMESGGWGDSVCRCVNAFHRHVMPH